MPTPRNILQPPVADTSTATDLYRDNQKLRRQMRAFLSQARDNEQKLQRFQEQELRLIGTRSLAELVQHILYDYRTAFGLDAVTLMLHDPQYELRRILAEEGVDPQQHPTLLFTGDGDAFDRLYGLSIAPVLGRYRADPHAGLFPGAHPTLGSVALLPLMRYGELIGSLHLGSVREERFLAGSATDFLERLCTVAAICLENAANHERLKRVGLTDSLTGVNNRRFFDQRQGEEVARAVRNREWLSCLFLDVDKFKGVNDRHGHQAGDLVLREVAVIIRDQLRSTDVLARYGGEEFAALLPGAAPESAQEIAERVRECVAQRAFVLPNGGVLHITISIGVACLLGTGQGSATTLSDGLLDGADQALYAAKHDGRNRVVMAPPATSSLHAVP